MNEAKPTKWHHLLPAVVITISSALIVKFIETHVNMNLIKSLFQTFFIELWPIWFGTGMGLIYWALREIISIHKFLKKGLKFGEKISELDAERREFMTRINNAYNHLSRQINEIEKINKDTKKEIEFIKRRACIDFIKMGNNLSYKAANIYRNFAVVSNNNPHNSLVYSCMALEQYIEVEDQEMIRQLLNEIIIIIKKTEHGSLSSKDVSKLNEIVNRANRKQFASEIQQINKLMEAIT